MNILIKNAIIITMEDENPVVKGDIGISGKEISFVGKSDTFTPDVVKDIRGNIVMPGLINAHTHTPMTVLRCYADDLDLHSWLFDKIFPAEETLTEEDIYWGSMLGCWEMIAGGTTAYADMYFLNSGTARAAIASGMRANICRALQCFDDRTSFENDERMCQALDLYTQYNGAGEGRIAIDMSVHAVYTNTPEYLKFVSRTVDRLNAGVHIHVSETERENVECIEKYGMTPTEVFEKCGFFRTRTIAAHSIYLTDEDIRIYKKNSVNIACNPTSNLKLASGICPIGKYMREGINVALGTDGAASNNNLSMFEEIHLAALLQKGVNKRPDEITAYEALKMATCNGAKALGIEKCGILKAGYFADLIILDTGRPHFIPYYDPISAVVYSAQAGDVDSVMVAGEFLMENRQIKTLDTEQIKYKISKIADRFSKGGGF